MRKVFCAHILLFCWVVICTAQSTDTLVTISGTLYRAQDSTTIAANILYEKLPYYDDMGLVSVDKDGLYEVQLVKGETYSFSISKPGYRKYQSNKEINGDAKMDLYVEEDIIELRKLENLNFASGSDRIGEPSYQELDELAEYLLNNPTLVIQLEGHTDFAGNAEANLRLSQARVEAVKNYLTDKKVKKNRIFTKAFGGTEPLTQERTQEGKAQNRRVEVRFIRR
ncbi:MAG: OmpA family protein [Bacteroidota bacterium]